MDIELGVRGFAPEDIRAGQRAEGARRRVEGRPGEQRVDRVARSRPGSGAEAATGVVLDLSARAAAALGARGVEDRSGAPEDASSEASDAEEAAAAGGQRGRRPPGELTPEEEDEVRTLKRRDTEVRAHENAHKAAAGRWARGGPRYDFERGPDGRRYAVGGEVQIDTAPVPNDPDATIRKMQQVRRAALAPAEPSPQDRRVAAEASQSETRARAEKLAAQREARRAEGADETREEAGAEVPTIAAAGGGIETGNASSSAVDPGTRSEAANARGPSGGYRNPSAPALGTRIDRVA